MSTVSVLDALGESHSKLVEVRAVLERADSVLAVADEVVVRAEEVIETGRRVLPVVLVAAVVLTVVGAGTYLWRRRSRATTAED
jgi:hypothetical protein